MDRLSRLAITFIIGLLVCGCSSDESTQVIGTGWIVFALDVEAEDDAPIAEPFALTLKTEDGAFGHTWSNIDDFSTTESYYTGRYVAQAVSGVPESEGYGCQCYVGETTFDVKGGIRNLISISCSLQQAMVKVGVAQSSTEMVYDVDVVLHTAGYSYNRVNLESDDNMLVMPGETSIFVTLKDIEGMSICLSPDFMIQTQAGEVSELQVTIEDGSLIISSGDCETVIELNDSLFESQSPKIAPSGFVPGEKVSLIEGFPSVDPIMMDISASANLKSVVLTTMGLEDLLTDFPKQIDLMQDRETANALGLGIVNVSGKEMTVDFTALLSDLSVKSNTNVVFYVQAQDVLGLWSEVMTLDVQLENVELKCISQTDAYIGENTALLTLQVNVSDIEPKDFSVWMVDDFNNILRELKMESTTIDYEQRLVKLLVDVGVGTEPVKALVKYMDNAELSTIINRNVKPYAIVVDAFATTAVIVFDSEDENTTSSLVSQATVYANGAEVGILNRLPERGIMRISGLKPSQDYEITVETIKGAFMPQAKIRTEQALDVPGGDFEDADVSISYADFPQGGQYSTSVFPIYNMQNFTDIKVYWPQKYWTSVNDKTFCKSAKNKNTWYMQPSSAIDFTEYVSGSKSIKISSVGWSLDGEDVMPYVQEPGQYLSYNANVPYVEHSSAGKLFLGSYTFDPNTLTEVYDEGVSFGSRPSSLNGFYKYNPVSTMPTDRGLVEIELINDENNSYTVIAKASMELHAAPDFIAFNLPLEYEKINLKTTRLKIGFMSSSLASGLTDEDDAIVVAPNVPQARYVGSELWIDNLTFSY